MKTRAKTNKHPEHETTTPLQCSKLISVQVYTTAMYITIMFNIV